MSCSRTQCSEAGEAQTRGPSVSSQALYHCATAFPFQHDHLATVQSLYNTSYYNIDLDITRSGCGSQIFLTMEFYKGIIGK